MARLPRPGGDSGTWGDVLNEFLSQAHNADGTLRSNSVTANTLAPSSVSNSAIASNAINATSIADGSITDSLLADGTLTEQKLSASVQSKLNSPSSIADGSLTKAKLDSGVQDSLDRADSALQSAPVTSVATRTGAVTLTKSDVGLSNVDNTSDPNKPVSTAMQTALDARQLLSAKDQPNGYAGLGNDGKLTAAQLPDLALIQFMGTKASQSAMLATSGEQGDWVIRSDTNPPSTWQITSPDPTQLSSWTQLPALPAVTWATIDKPPVVGAGASEEAARNAIKAELAGHRAEIDFTTKSDGVAPAALDTGQPVNSTANSGTAGSRPIISSGALVWNGVNNAGGNCVTYFQADCSAETVPLTEVGCEYIQPSGTNDGAGLLCIALWDHLYVVNGTPTPSTRCHFTIRILADGTGQWSFYVGDGIVASPTILFSVLGPQVFTLPAIDGTSKWHTQIDVNETTGGVTIILPGSQVAEVTKAQIDAKIEVLNPGGSATFPAISALGWKFAMIEHLATAPGANTRLPKFTRMWAD